MLINLKFQKAAGRGALGGSVKGGERERAENPRTYGDSRWNTGHGREGRATSDIKQPGAALDRRPTAENGKCRKRVACNFNVSDFIF